jgi:hypothetical protein
VTGRGADSAARCTDGPALGIGQAPGDPVGAAPGAGIVWTTGSLVIDRRGPGLESDPTAIVAWLTVAAACVWSIAVRTGIAVRAVAVAVADRWMALRPDAANAVEGCDRVPKPMVNAFDGVEIVVADRWIDVGPSMPDTPPCACGAVTS